MPHTPKYVYAFAEGHKDLKDLLGGKGANLAEMTNLGLPVPPGFTITTEACRAFLATGDEPPGLRSEVEEHLRALETRMGRRLGQPDNPLLVSVRSGAAFSMPGMMDTVLNIGLSDASVGGLAAQAGDDRFAWDSYRRLIQMFGKTVLGVDGDLFEERLEAVKRAKGASSDLDLDTADLRGLVAAYKDLVADVAGTEFPQDPRKQLGMAVRAVFASWNGDRARLYRRQEHIPDDLGTAVNIVAMVFGNLGADSGTGVAFTRDPASGKQGVYGDYLANAQGEDVVAGLRNTVPLAELERLDKVSYDRLLEIMRILEDHYRDLCDIEFTIERGTLWMLQTRVGKRTAEAAFRIAAQLVEQGLIDEDEALRRVSGAQLAQLMFPRFADAGRSEPITRGIAASPGAAVGKAVFDQATAVAWAHNGERVILVRRETNPDDLAGMVAAEGILTSRGGKTSHAAVVARGMGKTCVCGAEALHVDPARRRFTTTDGIEVTEGDVISVDGTTGCVYLGEAPVVPSAVAEHFENDGFAEGTVADEDADELLRAVDRIMTHADRRRRMRVRANADTADDAARALRFGAQGIGLLRTEHMFLGERRKHVERLVLADTDEDRAAALDALLPLQRHDFAEVLAVMDGLRVTIRLLDPPLHEFLPDLTDLSVRVALAGADATDKTAGTTADQGADHTLGTTSAKTPAEASETADETSDDAALLAAVRRLHEHNPMLGLRGVRLGLVIPGLFAMQIRAIAEATVERIRAGGTPHAEVMVPLVAGVRELEIIRDEARQVFAAVTRETGVDVSLPVGTMIELPRAALTAGRIAEAADFFSFGTNDLTQTTWGFSRDDVEASFFTQYLDAGIFGVSPFETIDADGVGRLVALAVREGRATRPDIALGVCGEHGGDPDSVRFFHDTGLDYVSCSPFRLPVARLEAGRATVLAQAHPGDA